MSAIRVDQVGQLGNQMFDYAIAKVLAHRTGLSYRPPAGFLTKSGAPLRWTGEPLFQMVPSPGRSPTNGRPINRACGHWLNLEDFDHATKIRLRSGYYQHYAIYRPYKELIRQEWLRLRVPFVETDPEVVYCHVRRMDYAPPRDPRATGLSTTLEEIRRCLQYFPDARRLVVTTDDPRDPWHQELNKLGIPWSMHGGTWDQDLLLLLSAHNLLISQSTYSWWAGFLGQATRIVCPLSRNTLWWYGRESGSPPTKGDYPNLIVDDEPGRWIWAEED